MADRNVGSFQSIVRSNDRLLDSLTTHPTITWNFIPDGVLPSLQDGPLNQFSYMQNRHAVTTTTIGQLIRFFRCWKHSRLIGLTVVDQPTNGKIVPLGTFLISDERALRTLKDLLWLMWVEWETLWLVGVDQKD